MRVLIVEDAEELAMLAQMALEAEGWSVELAHDGAAALAYARPDHQLFLVDLGLPDMDGEALVRYLRSDAALSAIPVIWFTAQSEEAPLGGVGTIGKPFNPTTLADEIARMLSSVHG